MCLKMSVRLVTSLLVYLTVNIISVSGIQNAEHELCGPNDVIVLLRPDAPITHTLHELLSINKISQTGLTQDLHSLKTKRWNKIGRKQFLVVGGDAIDMDILRTLPLVDIVEQNSVIKAFGNVRDITDSTVTEHVGIQCAPQFVSNIWGLDRLDQRDSISSPYEYIFSTTIGDGAGVNAYIVDSGITTNLTEFEGRASWGFVAAGMLEGDGNGHGTHVAGTVGAATYGVAKNVNLIAVKVLNLLGSGYVSDIVEGLEWVVSDYNQKGKPNSVINLSLGTTGISETFDSAMQEAIDAGITIAAAAGNSDEDACASSPGNVIDAITVGATDKDDIAASFSNWGTCLDVWAPGVDILSVTPFLPDKKSGTSMAAPHVAGAIARYLSTMTSERPSPAEVAHWVDSMATVGQISYSGASRDVYGQASSPNKLLYVDCAEAWTTPPMTSTTSAANVVTCAINSIIFPIFVLICLF